MDRRRGQGRVPPQVSGATGCTVCSSRHSAEWGEVGSGMIIDPWAPNLPELLSCHLYLLLAAGVGTGLGTGGVAASDGLG